MQEEAVLACPTPCVHSLVTLLAPYTETLIFMNEQTTPANHSAVSVVVIGRNEGARLVRCLQSVQQAHWGNTSFELIYVDSRSTDDSLASARALGGAGTGLGGCGVPGGQVIRRLLQHRHLVTRGAVLQGYVGQVGGWVLGELVVW